MKQSYSTVLAGLELLLKTRVASDSAFHASVQRQSIRSTNISIRLQAIVRDAIVCPICFVTQGFSSVEKYTIFVPKAFPDLWLIAKERLFGIGVLPELVRLSYLEHCLPQAGPSTAGQARGLGRKNWLVGEVGGCLVA